MILETTREWTDCLNSLQSHGFVPFCTAFFIYISLKFYSPHFHVDRALYKSRSILIFLVAYTSYNHLQKQSLLWHIYNLIQQELENIERALGNTLLTVLILRTIGQARDYIRKVPYISNKQIFNVTGNAIIDFLKRIPYTAQIINKNVQKIEKELQLMIKPSGSLSDPQYLQLPDEGLSDEELMIKLKDIAGNLDDKWYNGSVSGAVYHGEKDHLAVLNETYALFSVSNPLHADIWPNVVKMESQVIQMTASLVNGADSNVCGCMSSGGSESIFLAAKTHRNWYRQKHGICHPEIIAATTAHAAIDKACEILNIRLIKVPVHAVSLQMNCNAVKWSLSANTIMIYASAPNYPNGVIDDIAALSEIAQKNDVGLHVDCCLGGFILPFAKNICQFDFQLPGVTSMSCDLHKYGYAAKGTSVVLYRNKEIRRHQYFSYPDWSGGLYVTPTLAGSRPGALSATAWASLVRLGRNGFEKNTQEILEVAQDIKKGVQKIDALYVLGDPQLMIVSFASRELDILRVNGEMSKRNWNLNALQHPLSIHICVTMRHIGKADLFLQDLKEAVSIVKKTNMESAGSNAIYGRAASMPAGPVDDILRIYTDLTLDACT